jgi:hypothetical protein
MPTGGYSNEPANADGIGALARFSSPAEVALDAAGSVVGATLRVN